MVQQSVAKVKHEKEMKQVPVYISAIIHIPVTSGHNATVHPIIQLRNLRVTPESPLL